MAVGVLMMLPSCGAKKHLQTDKPTPTPLSQSPQPSISWPKDPTQSFTDREELKRVWIKFEGSQRYRLAKPSDRILSPAALARANSNDPNQIVPFLLWWGVRGLVSRVQKDPLVVIVVDPARSDQNRYGLVVLAAPISEGQNYKPGFDHRFGHGATI
jgi:hypothetical protein